MRGPVERLVALRWLPVALAVAFVVWNLLVVAPNLVLPVPYEYDDYHGVAQELLAGRLTEDPYHSWLYPEFIAAVAPACGSTLFAARLVSALAAAGALLAVASLGRTLAGPRAGIAAAVLVASNAWFQALAAVGASDMLATAFVATALGQLARHAVPEARSVRALWLASLAAGLAAATRYSTAPLLGVVLVVAAWVGAARGAPRLRSGAAGVARAAVGWAVGFAPHGLPAAICYGSPFHSLAWQNMVLKVEHGWDAFRHDPAAHPSLFGFLAARGGDVLAAGWHDCCELAATGLAELLLGVRVPAVLGVCVAAAVVLAVASAARPPAFAPAAVWSFVATMLTCFTFRMDCRVMLPVLPVVVIALVAVVPRVVGRFAAGLFVGAWLGQCALLPCRLDALYQQQPHAEVELARALPHELGRTPVLGSTYMLMRQQVPYRITFVAPLPAAADSAACWRRLREIAARAGCDTFLVGRRTGAAWFAGCGHGPVPEDFSMLRQDGELLLIGYAHPGSAAITSAAIEPDPSARGSWRCSLVSDASVPDGDVAFAGFLRAWAGDSQPAIQLERRGDGRWEQRIAAPAPDEEFVPFLLLRDGSVRRGKTVRVRLR